MDKQRKNIILKEIKYWKETNLLPTKYCDYLIALYTEGEGIEEERSDRAKQRGKMIYFDLLFLLLLVLFSLLASYFFANIQHFILSFIIILVILLLHIYYFYKKQSSYVHFALILFFLHLLIGSTTIIADFVANSIWIHFVTFLNCLVWIGIGFIRKYLYLTLSGFIGIVIIIAIIVI